MTPARSSNCSHLLGVATVLITSTIGCIARVGVKADALPEKIRADDALACLKWKGESQFAMIGRDVAGNLAKQSMLGAKLAELITGGQYQLDDVQMNRRGGGVRITWTVKDNSPYFCGAQAVVVSAARHAALLGLKGVWQFYDCDRTILEPIGMAYAAQVVTEVQGEVVDGCGEVNAQVNRAKFGGKTMYEVREKLCVPRELWQQSRQQ
jgi:hypothetical protein